LSERESAKQRLSQKMNLTSSASSKPKRKSTKASAPRKSKPKPIIVEIAKEEVAALVENLPINERANVLFEPNEGPQTSFLASVEQEVLYGGAAGGGKSYALLADPMRYFNHRGFRGLILRKTTEELRELISVSQELYPSVFPGAKWSERKLTWTFPAGGTLWLTYLERDEDVTRYQGQAFTYIGFDELTQWRTPYAWNYLRSRLRTTAKDLPVFQRGTTNPGGPGHAWVKKMFIDPSPFDTSFVATDIETGEELRYPEGHTKAGQPLLKRRFIPAKLADNPYLSMDGQYEANLLSLPEAQRARLLDGNWDIAEGAAFPEFNRNIHVVEPFDIPSNWTKFRACDYGYGSYSAVIWFALHPATQQLVIYREIYVSKTLADELVLIIEQAESKDGRVSYGMLDSSLWHNRGDRGPCLSDQLSNNHVRWRPSDRSKGSRIAGKNQLHSRFKVDEFTGEPGIVIFSSCTDTIAQLPAIPLDKNNPEDVDTKSEDHIYDAIRYGIMSRPRNDLFAYQPGMGHNGGPRMADTVFGY